MEAQRAKEKTMFWEELGTKKERICKIKCAWIMWVFGWFAGMACAVKYLFF